MQYLFSGGGVDDWQFKTLGSGNAITARRVAFDNGCFGKAYDHDKYVAFIKRHEAYRDRALFAGLDHAADDLLALDGFAGSVAFDDPQLGPLDLLVGGVAVGASEAFATAADGGAVLRHPRVEHLVLE